MQNGDLALPPSGYTRGARLDNGLWEVTCRVSERYSDGELAPEEDVSAPILWRTRAVERGLVGIELAESATPAAPPTWFVHVPELRSSPVACNLVAFVDDRVAAGTVLSRHQFASLGIRNELQAAAVRWYPGSGLVHQVFVAPAWRRRHLATHVLYAAEAFHQANGWPGHLHGDGRRTELGERLVAGLRHPERFRPLSETMPPMDE